MSYRAKCPTPNCSGKDADIQFTLDTDCHATLVDGEWTVTIREDVKPNYHELALCSVCTLEDDGYKFLLGDEARS